MRLALRLNHALIALFGVASGAFKVLGGQADLDVFAHLGLTAPTVAAFGGAQLGAALLTLWPRARVAGALGLAGCNALATAGLFAAGVQPFGVISVSFVLMALLVARPPATSSAPAPAPSGPSP